MSVNAITSADPFRNAYFEEYLSELYDRDGIGEASDERSLKLKTLQEDPVARAQFQRTFESEFADHVKLAETDPAQAQIEIAKNLHDLNFFRLANWAEIDPDFRRWLDGRNGESIRALNKIESEHPELKPSGDADLDLLVRSKLARENYQSDMLRTLDSLDEQAKTDPKAAYDWLGGMLTHWRAHSAAFNWDHIDPRFAWQLRGNIQAAELKRMDLEKANPGIRFDSAVPTKTEREAFLSDIKSQVAKIVEGAHVSPQGAHDGIVKVIDTLKGYAARFNWNEVDPDFGARLEAEIGINEAWKLNLEREHPQIRL